MSRSAVSEARGQQDLCAVGLLTHRAGSSVHGSDNVGARQVRRPAAQAAFVALAALLMFALASLAGARASAADDEQTLIAVLQSDKPVGDKAAACLNLKRVGTARAVPALAALLTDKDLSHWARYALESMPCPEAGAALRDAVAKAAGLMKVGIIDSIGERRDREATGALAELASGTDVQVVTSAAAALGKIGTAEAARALRAAHAKAPAATRLAVADGALQCAAELRAAGDNKTAAAVCQELYDPQAPEYVRTGAYRGLVLASGDQATALMAKALTGTDWAAIQAALQLAPEIKGEAATKELAAVLANVPPAVQVALIEALKHRGDPAAGPAVVSAIASPSPKVRLAAFEALPVLGDASAAPQLAEAAAKAAGAEQEAARDALAIIRDPKVRETLLAQLPKAQPAVQAEIVRALGHRQEKEAVPSLLKMAEGGDEPTRLVVLRSIAMLADASAAADLIRLLGQAKSDAEREAVEGALAAACGRGGRPEASAARVLGAMKGTPVPARAALLRVAGRVGGAEAAQALRAGLQDTEAAIKDAALRTMADFGGADVAPDLLKLAREAPAPAQKVLALRGYWRLVALAADRPMQERWKMGEAAMAAAQRPEEKKLGLTELAKIPHPAALKLALSLCEDEAVAAEAEAATVQIAGALAGTLSADAKAALKQVAAKSKSQTLRAEANKALDAFDQYVGYITTWMVAGPYRVAGKECQELFNMPLPPEQAGTSVKWQALAPPADASLFWQADLSGMIGGDHAVAYLKTRVWAPREQKVRFDIGTDDGIKMWVNAKLVHSNNAIRGLTPSQDKAEGVLKEGWNDFLLKITQHTLGCGACVRIRAADGAIIDGLKFDAAAR